jgi:hypothetical protein
MSYIGIMDMKVYLVAQNVNDVSITMSVEVPLGKHQCLNWTNCYYACCSFCICDKSSLQNIFFVKKLIIVYIHMSMNYFENQIYDSMRRTHVRWTNKVVDVSMHGYLWLTNAMFRLNESHVVDIITKIYLFITIFVNLGFFWHFETNSIIRTWIKSHIYWRMS